MNTRGGIIGLVLLAASAQAQSSTLPSRLGPDVRATIERLMDSVRAAGLPTGPLADKAAEGVLKGADDQRILVAVRMLARELGEARAILGSTNDPAALSAMASALHAGAAPAELRRIARPSGSPPDSHTLATALVTLVDLVAKRIPPLSATNAVNELLRRRATDDQFVVLRSEVEQDIRGGVDPEAALTKRIRAHVELLETLPLSGRTIKPPPPPPV
jgi:hypothetical protein